MKPFILLLIIAIFAVYPVSGQKITENVSLEQADTLIMNHEGKFDLVILDVRTPDEFMKGHLKNAKNIDFWGHGFVDSLATYDLHRIYLIYCTSGVRSSGAMKKMSKLGFMTLYNMKSGMFGWRNSKRPLTSD